MAGESDIKIYPNLKFKLKKLIYSNNSIIGRVAQKWQSNKYLVDRNTIVVEGYPRSGNTFLVELVQQHYNPEFRVLSHTHSPFVANRAAGNHCPCLLLIRNPVDAIASYHVYSGVSIKNLIDHYRWYYETLNWKTGDFLIVDFKKLVADPTQVLRNIFLRYPKAFQNSSDCGLEVIVESVLDSIQSRSDAKGLNYQKIAIPSPLRTSEVTNARKIIQFRQHENCMKSIDKLYNSILEKASVE
jgi:hypothetical protein